MLPAGDDTEIGEKVRTLCPALSGCRRSGCRGQPSCACLCSGLCSGLAGNCLYLGAYRK